MATKVQSVPIKGVYDGHGVSSPKNILKLFRPVKFCKGKEGEKPVYSLAAWSDYLDDISAGSLIFIALKDDLGNFTKKDKPFIYVKHAFSERDAGIVKRAKQGQQFSFDCGCTYEVIPISEFPTDVEFQIIITGHNVDER